MTTNATCPGATTYASTARGCTGVGVDSTLLERLPERPPKFVLSVCRLPSSHRRPRLWGLFAHPAAASGFTVAHTHLPVCYETRHVSVRLMAIWHPLCELPARALPAFLACRLLFCDCLESALYIFWTQSLLRSMCYKHLLPSCALSSSGSGDTSFPFHSISAAQTFGVWCQVGGHGAAPQDTAKWR